MKAVVVCHNCLNKLHDGYRVKTSNLRSGRCEECGRRGTVVTATIIKGGKIDA